MTDRARPLDRLVGRFPVFARMPPARLEEVRSKAQVRSVAAGEQLFSAGTPCSGFPLLVSGSARVIESSPEGREIQLYRVRPGEACILSAGCLLGNAGYGASGIAETPLEVVVLPPPLFDALMQHEPEFRRWVFALFSERLSETMRLVEAVSFERLDRRLARYLARNGPVVRTSQERLAAEIGTVREMVGRVLRNFEDRGLVALRRGEVRILDAPAIERLAAGAEAGAKET